MAHICSVADLIAAVTTTAKAMRTQQVVAAIVFGLICVRFVCLSAQTPLNLHCKLDG